MEPDKISAVAMKQLLEPSNTIFFSTVSIHELQIKSQLGKLSFKATLQTLMEELVEMDEFQLLRVEPEHIYAISALPDVHRDPFDRLLIAQAQSTRCALMSSDSLFAQYPIQVLW
jgi:PIN domain nuclease of toxin-antitoxin system